MIGLLDYDAFYRGRRYLPNLQFMKLYRYLTHQGDVVKLIQSSDECQELDEIYIRCQHASTPSPDDRFYNLQNVHIGGQYYSTSKYVPFNNLQIQKTTPSLQIYRPLLKTSLNTWASYDLNYQDLFCRLNGPVKPNFDLITPGRKVLIYDQDLMQTNNYKYLEEIIDRGPRIIAFNHRLAIQNQRQFNDIKTLMLKYPHKFRKQSMQLKMLWPASFEDFRDLWKENQELLSLLSLSEISFPLIIDNYKKMQYNLIDGMKKNKWLRLKEKAPQILYTNDTSNKYNDLALSLRDKSISSMRRNKTLYYKSTLKLTPVVQQQINQLNKYDDIMPLLGWDAHDKLGHSLADTDPALEV